MARRLVSLTNYSCSLGFVFLFFVLVSAIPTSLLGQATPWNNSPSNTWSPPATPVNQIPPSHLYNNPFPWYDPVTHTPPNTSSASTNGWQTGSSSRMPGFLPTPYQTPNPYGRPTREQTIWFVENHPDLQTLDAVTKQNLVNGASLPWITASLYLPGGARNPLYGGNWYVPSTWPSSTMNWQGVQRDGSLGNPAINSYNPSYVLTYRPTPPTPARVVNRPPPPIGEKPVQARIQTTKNQTDRSLDSRPSGIRKAIEDGERALSVHDAAGDKVAQAIDHAELAGLYGQDNQLKQALEHIGIAERMAEGIPDPRSGAVFWRRDAAAHMSLGEFEQSIAAYQKAMQILRSVDDEKGQAEVYASIGWAFQSLGDAPHALSCYGEALYLFTKLGDKDGKLESSSESAHFINP